MPYEPKQIDTSHVTLPSNLEQLVDLLARNTHEVWANRRSSEGWRLGSARNDLRKEHPDLVPYDELAESEKEYDRQIAYEAIKTIFALGFHIESSGSRDSSPTGQLASPTRPLDSYRLEGEAILKLGEPLRAYDLLREGAEHFPGDPRIRQLLGLALARSGATTAANRLLTALVEEGHRDEETLGLLARTHKDFALAQSDPAEASRHLGVAFQHYSTAYRATGGYWCGINAATVAVLLGQMSSAVALAQAVRLLCRSKLDHLAPEGDESYWLLSTLGEAALILGESSEAEASYSEAISVGKGRWANLQATRRQARLLLERLGDDSGRLDKLFPIPRVCVFAGHMIDQPGRATPRFPPQIESAVREAIVARLRSRAVGFGYASAACGADILFHEALLDLTAESHVVLPYGRDFFRRESVDLVPDAHWGDRFDRVLKRATAVKEISTQPLAGNERWYEYGNLYLQGLAQARAEVLEADLLALAVWDTTSSDGPAGTASNVQRWRDLGLAVEIIELDVILRREVVATVQPAQTPPNREAEPRTHGSAEEFAPEICGLLFADAVGFSKLSESEVPLFVRHFLGAVAELMRSSPRAPVYANTWGDALYCVFSKVGDAGRFALDLCDRISETDWGALQLPALGARIGLHAGPVFRCTDPVTQRPNYIGAHVSRAARIEPITPPDKVYASEAFVALASVEGANDFRCEYVGQTSLAKNFGRYPTYVLSRRIR